MQTLTNQRPRTVEVQLASDWIKSVRKNVNKLKASHFWAPCCKHPVSGDFLSLAHFILVQEEDKRKLFSQGDVYSEYVTIDGILFPLLQYSVRDDK